ncbi:Lactose transport system permease protein LacG [Geobacillus sp. BCO2]|nr:Lactose transport system permease protein LacG [Geobacillus sp. BCO2]
MEQLFCGFHDYIGAPHRVKSRRFRFCVSPLSGSGSVVLHLHCHHARSMGSDCDPKLFDNPSAWLDKPLRRLIVPFWAMAFGIFLLRQQFKQIPHELYEAAQLSGIGNFRFFCRVVLPLSKTSLVTLAVYSFLDAWNMYLWPLLVTNDDRVRTVQIGLKQLQTQEIASSWGVVMAAAVIAMLPTLLLLFAGQKQLRKGLCKERFNSGEEKQDEKGFGQFLNLDVYWACRGMLK